MMFHPSILFCLSFWVPSVFFQECFLQRNKKKSTKWKRNFRKALRQSNCLPPFIDYLYIFYKLYGTWIRLFWWLQSQHFDFFCFGACFVLFVETVLWSNHSRDRRRQPVFKTSSSWTLVAGNPLGMYVDTRSLFSNVFAESDNLICSHLKSRLNAFNCLEAFSQLYASIAPRKVF